MVSCGQNGKDVKPLSEVPADKAVKVLSDEMINGTRVITVEPCDIVCSTQIVVRLKGNVIKKVTFTNGCPGNTQGVAALVQGMKIKKAIERLDGINCANRGTSCPDQLSQVLKMALEEIK